MKSALLFFAYWSVATTTAFAEEAVLTPPKLGSISGTFTATAPLPVGIPPWLPNLKDETLIINPKNSGLANLVVFLVPKKQPERKLSDGTKTIVLNQASINQRITLLVAGDKLQLVNNEQEHVLMIVGGNGTKLRQFVLAPGEKDVNQFKLALGIHQEILGSYPMQPNRPAFIQRLGFFFILGNKYAAVTDNDGAFSIKDIPYGDYDLRFWHEHYSYEEKLEFKLNGAILKKTDSMKLKIDAEKIDLGTFDYTLK